MFICHRNKTLTTIRELCDDQVLASNPELWNGRARNELMEYEEHLYEFYKRGLTDRGEKVWTFWNAVFYCGTIYTTIGESRYPTGTFGQIFRNLYGIFRLILFKLKQLLFGLYNYTYTIYISLKRKAMHIYFWFIIYAKRGRRDN